MVHACAVRHRRRRGIRVGVDDLVAALFALADDGGDAAQDAFTFGVGAFLGVAVEDFGGWEEASFGGVCDGLGVSVLWQ